MKKIRNSCANCHWPCVPWDKRPPGEDNDPDWCFDPDLVFECRNFKPRTVAEMAVHK